jgi:PAS domain S-box-containing protein
MLTPELMTLHILGMCMSCLQATALGAGGMARGAQPYIRRWWLGALLVAASFVCSVAANLWPEPARALRWLSGCTSVAGFAAAYDGFQCYFGRPPRSRAWYTRLLAPIFGLLALFGLLSAHRALPISLIGFVTIALTLPNIRLLALDQRDGRHRPVSVATALTYAGFVVAMLLRMAAYVFQEESTLDPHHWMHVIFASYLVVFFPALSILLVLLHSRRSEDDLHSALVAQRDKAEELDRYFNTSRDLLAIVDTQGRLEKLNRQFTRTLGRPLEELLHTPFLALISPADRGDAAHMLEQIRSQAPVQDVLLRCPAASGKERVVEWQGQPAGAAQYLVGRDVTRRVELEDQLHHAQKMEIIGLLAGGLAHDFNNALSGILGASEVLAERLPSGSPEQRSASTISDAALRASELTKQLLVFSRKDPIAFRPVNVHETTRSALGLLRHSVDGGIRLNVALDAEEPLVHGDPSLLQSAILNLGLNARDAMPDGGSLSVTTKNVRLDATTIAQNAWTVRPGTFIQIDVSDTGVGMSEDVRKHVFEPFFTTKPPGRGTGLGLASVYATIERHHGAIAVHSQPGRGTTFTIELPLHPS